MAFFDTVSTKIFDQKTIAQAVAAWRVRGQKIVFTNGCFDILHFGHLHYLMQARDLGDRLIIGLNSGESVRKLKGPTRPIHDEQTRIFQLAALEFVDAVVVFETDTPLELIQIIAPDFLVKGGDWQPEQIVGSDFVAEKGGKTLSLPFVEGFSTTSIEARILERHEKKA